jgi:Chaperone of endosialidase
LFAGDNAWTTGSDVRTKENFSEISGEDFLKKIADFKLTTWNYKTQNPKTFRHYGPMAQDFYAAFGKDEYGTIGNDTTINSADFAGVSFVAIQALEKRTAEYKKEVDELKTENTTFRTLLLQLRKEVDGLQGIKKEKL